MNAATFMGFLAAVIIFIISVTQSLDNIYVFFDFKAGLLVLGGTLAVTFICFPIKRLIVLFKVVFRRLFGKDITIYSELIEEICQYNEIFLDNPVAFEQKLESIDDLFVKDAFQAVLWIDSEITLDQLRELLEQRYNTQSERYMSEAEVFSIISKFPPAFGLMGTTLGLIAVLQNLGDSEGQSMIGPAMSIALLTTLYGVALSNMVLIPFAENITQKTIEDDIKRRIAIEGAILVGQRLPTLFIREKLNSFVLPGERSYQR